MMITFLKNKNHMSHTLFFRLLKLHLKKSEPASRNLILEGEKAYSRRARRETYLSERDLHLSGHLTENQKMGRTTRPGLSYSDSLTYSHKISLPHRWTWKSLIFVPLLNVAT